MAAPTRPTLRSIVISLLVASLGLPVTGSTVAAASTPPKPVEDHAAAAESQSATSAGALSFSSPAYGVDETGGSVTVTLTRTGGSEGAVSARVALADVTTSPADYGAVGTADSFDPAPNSYADAIAVQPDGKVLVGGDFTMIGGEPRDRLARFNPDGSLDTAFNPPSIDGYVAVIVVQPDGKVLVGGSFTSVGGVQRIGLARLNPDGSLDVDFSTNFFGGANVIALQPDGKILVGGAAILVRYHPDGSLDTGFNPPPEITSNNIFTVAGAPDGSLFVGGELYLLLDRGHIAKLDADGTLNTTFRTIANSPVVTIVPQPDGKLLLGGWFNRLYLDGNTAIVKNHIARIHGNGQFDPTFNSGTNAGTNEAVMAIAVQPDGKAIAGGAFSNVNLQQTGHLARLNTNGSTDTAFSPNANGEVRAVVIQPDGKVLAAGDFSSIGGQPRNRLARLNEYFATWADGDTSDKTVTIPIHDDALAEGNESLTLSMELTVAGTDPGENPTATLTILDDEAMCAVPFVTQDPSSQSVSHGASVSFTASASGSPEPTVQWQENSSGSFLDIPGATSTTLSSTAGTMPFVDGVEFRAVFANDCLDPATTSEATLTVTCPSPTVTQNPSGSSASYGESVSFTAAATGTPAPFVQWQYQNAQGVFVDIPGATSTTLTGTAGTEPFSNGRVFRAFFSNGCNTPAHTTGAQLFVSCPSATVTEQPSDQSANYAESVTFSAAASGSPAPDLVQWQQNHSGVFVDIPGATSTTLAGTAGTMPFVDGVEFRAVFSLSSACSSPVTTSPARLGVTTNRGAFSFSSPAYRVEESAGPATITIRRTGGSDTAVSASISHLDVTTSTSFYDYDMPTVADTFFPGTNDEVLAIATQPDGKVLIGGFFGSVGGVGRRGLARLNPDGSLDTSFDPKVGDYVYAIAVQPDGKVLVGGDFVTVGGVPRSFLARLNPDGSVDSFDPQLDYVVHAIAVQPDGKVLVGGEFLSVGGVQRNGIARLNPDGSLDASFDAKVGGYVYEIEVQPDGKVLFGGEFLIEGDVPRENFARVNADGTLDAFKVNTNGPVYAISVQPDGKVFFGGTFNRLETIDGTLNHPQDLACVDADGRISESDFLTGLNGRVSAIVSQANGRLLVGGSFSIDGQTQRSLVRLSSSGALDRSFDLSLSAFSNVRALAIQADGQHLVGGRFAIGGEQDRFLARLTNYVVTWADGDTSDKTVTIPIVDDPFAEGLEYLTLSLQPSVSDVTPSANRTATLAILDDEAPCAPVVTTHPASLSVSPGAGVSFTAAATGSPEPTVQWQENSSGTFLDIPGATSTTLAGTAGTAPLLDGVQFRAVFTSLCGSATSDAATLSVLAVPEATTTALAASPTSAMLGQPVTLAATVTSGAGTPAGSVEFFDGAASLGSQPLSGGAASLTVSTLAPGTHAAITARYLPAGTFAESTSAPASVTVSTTRYTTTSLAVSPASPTVYGQAVVLSVTVTAPAGGVPTGQVKFFDGAMAIGGKTLSGGVASLTVTTLSAGTHSITAVYQGKAQFAASTSPAVEQTITQATTTTTLTSSLNPAPRNQSVTFTAVVSAVTPGEGTPAGQVAFYDGTTLLGTGNLMSGSATFKTKKLSVGSHAITAVYQGSTNHATSTSSVLAQQVN